jgi:hypothetical protein
LAATAHRREALGRYVALVAVYVGAGTLAVSGWWNGVLQVAFGL